MTSWNRIGTAGLALAGLAVAGLMAYTLFFAGWRSDAGLGRAGDAPGPASARAAIFLPDRRDWLDFRAAVEACEPKGILRLIAADDAALVVGCPRSGRTLRFERHGVRGVTDTRAAVRRLAEQGHPPVAVVGSTTTVLTVALAEPLREAGEAGPVLLVPWATAVMVQRSDVAGGRAPLDPVPLMDLDPGRTFRFCPNNRRLADSAVDCLVGRDGGRLPNRVFLIVDPFDPYSDDLASCFRQAIRRRKPDVQIDERADAVDLPTFAHPLGPAPEPSIAEIGLADAIVAGAQAGGDRPTWAVLPLQDQPARRLIAALRRRASWGLGPGSPAGAADGLRVVCGDAMERQAIDELAGRGGLPIWCASTSSAQPAGPDPGVDDDTQALAEIASALVWAVDQATEAAPTPTEVRDALRRIDLGADDPRAFGRRLAFDPGGERRGDPERVLEVGPAPGPPVEYARRDDGAWRPVEPVAGRPR